MSAFAFKSGPRPAFGLVPLFALMIGACSSTGSNQYTAENAAVAPRQAVAQGADTESDGLPAQTPPAHRANQPPDDPNEPYSRNYGGPNPSMRPLAKPETPKAVPVPVRQAAADSALTPPYWKVARVAAQDE